MIAQQFIQSVNIEFTIETIFYPSKWKLND
jgi:hypothetical protein